MRVLFLGEVCNKQPSRAVQLQTASSKPAISSADYLLAEACAIPRGALGADSVRVGAPGPDSRNSHRVANRQFRSSNGAGDAAKCSRWPRLAKPGTMSSPQPKRLWQKCLRTGWESLSIREVTLKSRIRGVAGSWSHRMRAHRALQRKKCLAH